MTALPHWEAHLRRVKRAGAIAVVGAVVAAGTAGGIFIKNQYVNPTPPAGGGSLQANVWIATTGGATCTRGSALAYADAGAGAICNTMAAAWTAANASDVIGVKGSTTSTCVGARNCTTFTSGCSASGSKASTTTITIDDTESAWFAGDGSISATNLKLSDNQAVSWPPANYANATKPGDGVGAGITCSLEGMTGQSVEFDNIDIWCRSTSPWHLWTSHGNTLCSAPIHISQGTDGFTMNGGSVGPVLDCDTCDNISTLSSCGSVRTGCQNITFNKVYFHDSRKSSHQASVGSCPAGGCDETHSEMFKIDDGYNILFENSWIEHCIGAGTSATDEEGATYWGGCTSAAFEVDQHDTETVDNITFLQNYFGAGGPNLNWSKTQPAGTRTIHIYFNTFSQGSNICYDQAGTGCAPSSSTAFIGNLGYKSQTGCVSGNLYSHNFWFTGNSETPASCGTGDVAATNDTWTLSHFVDATATPLTGSAVRNIAGVSECPSTDIFGNARPWNSGICDAGAVERQGS